jgi:hypothetical protein
MIFRTKERVRIPVRRFGKVPPMPGEYREARHLLAAEFLLLTAGAGVAAALVLYALW